MENNKHYKIAKRLIMITLVVMITIPVCFGVAFLSITVLDHSNFLSWLVGAVFYYVFIIGGIPCLAMSIIGTLYAIKAKKDGISKATVFIVLGIVLIPITAVWSYWASIISDAWMGV